MTVEKWYKNLTESQKLALGVVLQDEMAIDTKTELNERNKAILGELYKEFEKIGKDVLEEVENNYIEPEKKPDLSESGIFREVQYRWMANKGAITRTNWERDYKIKDHGGYFTYPEVNQTAQVLLKKWYLFNKKALQKLSTPSAKNTRQNIINNIE